jgi:methyl-accepting chemotaxis protein
VQSVSYCQAVRVLGFPIGSPLTIADRVLSDLGAVARAARAAPGQLDQLLDIGEEMVTIGRAVLEIAERFDGRAQAIMVLGERLESQATELIELGNAMHEMGERIDGRGAEIVIAARQVSQTGSELITVLPAFERALEMATPLEGAIDRFGRLVDRLPGGAPRRRLPEPADEKSESDVIAEP